MFRKCKYNPKRDINAVTPGLALDLSKAIESGQVLSTGVATEYNDISSPSEIVGRASDNFEVFNTQREIIRTARARKASSVVSPLNVSTEQSE